MWNKNRGGFNALFGQEIYITLTTIIVISILLFFLHGSTEVKDNNQLSSVDNMSSKLLKAGIGLTAIIGFISILSVGGVFSSNPPENNLAMLLNLFILIIFSAGIFLTYRSSVKHDKDTIEHDVSNIMAKYEMLNIMDIRNKYLLIFIALIFGIGSLYFFNPFGIMDKYGGSAIFFVMFIAMVMLTMMTIYQYFLKNPYKIKEYDKVPGLYSVLRIGYVILALFILGLLLWGLMSLLNVTSKNAYKNPQLYVNILLFVAFVGILYMMGTGSSFNVYNLMRWSTWLDLFMKYKVLFVSGGVLSGYLVTTNWLYPYLKNAYYTIGGKYLLNGSTIPLDNLTSIISYNELIPESVNTVAYFNPSYNCAFSFWLYLDSFMTVSERTYSLLHFGNLFHIKHNPLKNKTYICCNYEPTGDTTTMNKDINNDIILYTIDNTAQKWNNIVLNYNSGTLDIFYNGKLVKSVIEVSPYIKMDMMEAGEPNGLYGTICNLLFFNKSIDLLTVENLYERGVNMA